jgi:UDP-N-acetylglucosamine 1-carboxyvinyltransferase
VWRESARSRARIRPSGFKHLLVPALAAACLADEPWLIGNVPDIADTRVLTAALGAAGATVAHDRHAGTVAVTADRLTDHRIAGDLSSQVHGAVYLLPALLAATGRVVSGRHGGCRIGAGGSGERPLAHVAAVMERFGARCAVDEDRFSATAPSSGLRGTVIDLADFAVREPVTGTLTGPHYSGATKTALLLGAVARGVTVLRDPYPKADVMELARALGSAGVPVSISRDEIVVEGRGGPIGGTGLRLPSDLMEVVTMISLSVCLDTETRLPLDRPEAVREGIAPELACLERMGVPLTWDSDGLRTGRVERLDAVDVVAASHLVYSDALPLFVPMLLRASAPSRLTDLVWGSRFGYAEGLRRLGADLTVAGSDMVVRPSRLRPADAPLRAGDLRAVMALLLGALSAGGRHAVHGVRHLARGYDRLPEKLRLFGAGVLE